MGSSLAQPPFKIPYFFPVVPSAVKRVLVTGGAGFIGSHTVDLLVDRGYDVRVLDCLQPRVHPGGWPEYLPETVEKLRGDVCERADLEAALEGVDGVFHLAAYQDYMPDFSTFFRVNTVSTALLFEIIVARKLPVSKVVLASSQAVYGEGTYSCGDHGLFYPGPRSAEALDRGDWEIPCPECGRTAAPRPIEESVVNPHTAYGISKYSLEMTALSLGRKYGIPVANMRYSIVQGPRNSFFNAYSGIARIFTLRLLNDQPPICYEDGRQLRDYVYVGDAARANLLAYEDERADYQSFNVAGQRAHTVAEVAELLTSICGKQIEPVVSGEYRFGDTRHTASSAARLSRLGWRAEKPLEEILSAYVDWVRGRRTGGADYYRGSSREMRRQGILRTSRG